ncbi:ABC transporter substrate-binding protein [Pectobacteriaceae bacterium CE70]|nr:ABC transporter substrate-binding protein [Pectobacteriaceae bacterium C52]WJV68336.1 ABC transporter substrate-binding protein [Pectobacteriaceae bacterium CE70]WJY12266.1 ABC transporter substrate-binding protein [Pectobacteriaceae bacterium C80]
MKIQRRTFIRGMLAFSGQALLPPAKAASDLPNNQSVRDIANRDVTLRKPLRRIFLGEGNLFYTVAALCREDPLEKLVGWRDNFRTADLDSYNLYCRNFPKLAELPTFSGIQQMQFDLERLIVLRPDVMVLNLNTRRAVETSGMMDHLTASGIPVVFVDMSIHLMDNTARSITLMGTLFEQPARAAAINRFRQYHLNIIFDTLARAHPSIPRVLMERAAGLYDDCCLSWGKENFGEMVSVAGGNNIAAKLIFGTYGTLSQETVIASHPDKILVTGSNWQLYAPKGDWVHLGPNANIALAKHKLEKLMQRPAYRFLPAVKSRKVYAIWHPFYDHPFNFVAIQRLAKWFHPTLFAKVSAEQTLAELFERYLPIPWQPGYWTSLDDDEN